MKIALGTVQFGLDYGISNTNGKVPPAEVSRILNLAAGAGIRILDTAHGYGESEKVLGGALSGGKGDFRIVSKLPTLASAGSVAAVEAGFHRSLELLRCSRLAALLVHHAGDLLGPEGPALFRLLERLRDNGLVEKIGASVYTGEEIDALLARFPIEIVQLPVSVLDQRLARSGHLARLKSKGVEIHARSLFLQGLLLLPPERLPAYFGPIRPWLEKYVKALAAQGLNALEGSLLFLCDRPEIDFGVLGVCSAKELEEILAAMRKVAQIPPDVFDFSPFALDDPQWVNPALWPK